MTLANIPIFKKARIVENKIEEDHIKSRFSALGFIKGHEVEISFKAPLGGDPIAVKILGSTFAMRKNIADQIIVEYIE